MFRSTHPTFFFVSFFMLSLFSAAAQGPTSPDRIKIDPGLKPFYHGVASGDPQPDHVVIWTRMTPDSGDVSALRIYWEVATDIAFTHVVNYGYGFADEAHDYTFKTDVCGLQPNTYYYYMFQSNGQNSIIGRTKTAPIGDNDSARFAVVSCASYEHGYFHAYEDICNRNDVDAVIHLGDYIYEYETGGFSAGLADRVYAPLNEIISLSDYRIRHSHYKLDADLRRLHQLQPFITEWDDHESANDSYRDGAQNHTPGVEGDWVDRKHNAVEAYNEWMPFRKPDPTDTIRIWRKLHWGNLLDLIMIDSRLYDRDVQDISLTDNPSHKMLGRLQMNWLKNQFSDSTSSYKILCNQVMFAPLQIFGTPFNPDQWDGYNTDRQELENHIHSNNIQDVVILTGDIHTSWANDVPGSGYVSSTGANAICPEFVGTSVTSTNFDLPITPALIQALNPHMKYINLHGHGYMVFDVNKRRAQTDYMYISDVETHPYTVRRDASFIKLRGENHLSSFGTGLSGHLISAANPPLLPDASVSMTKVVDTLRLLMMENSSTGFCLLPSIAACPGYSVALLDSANFGQLSLSDSCGRYTPNHNFSGDDTILFTICQLNPYHCDTVPVYIHVRGFINRSYELLNVAQDSAIISCVSFNDLYGSVASSAIARSPSHGTATLIPGDTCLHYTPAPGFTGLDTLIIYACDSVSPVKCDSVFFFITVKPAYSKELVYAYITPDSILNICHAYDELAAPYTSSAIIVPPANGYAVLSSDSCLYYAPSVIFSGNDTLLTVACHAGMPLRCDTVEYIINIDKINAIRNLDQLVVFSISPNPFHELVVIQFYTYTTAAFRMKLMDMSGKIMIDQSFEANVGLHYAQIKGEGIPKGNYLLLIQSGEEQYRKKLVKE